MFDSDYFYSSAPSDISSDITINITENGDDEVSVAPSLDHHYSDRPQQRHVPHHCHSDLRQCGTGSQPSSVSLSDKIARKLFRKKRKEMLGGNNDR